MGGMVRKPIIMVHLAKAGRLVLSNRCESSDQASRDIIQRYQIGNVAAAKGFDYNLRSIVAYSVDTFGPEEVISNRERYAPKK